ncbi:MAG: hypothetical protein A2V70_10600 [Planctomycetes bacterium RBG_13_63_9]|nr:MAG: hypothetical protein A2V70_10600 [Planctomycetes bacterium RBG_13_63_9]
MTKDRWPELCTSVAMDDGLPTREVGHWTEDKLFFWNRYLDITTRAMVGHRAWPAGLVYVDLFAGPGICTLRGSGKRIPGSALIAANAPKPFERILLCEKDPGFACACEQRVKTIVDPDRFQVFVGDCNDRVGRLSTEIPDQALTLAFIDPTGLHAHFETIRTLSQRGAVDLLILFADNHDIVRNVNLYEEQGSESNLDQVLGPESNWRDDWQRLTNRSRENICQMFASAYKRQLESKLGYKEFGEETMRCASRPLYRLIYASKHERGLDFWQKITKKDAGGQMRLF